MKFSVKMTDLIAAYSPSNDKLEKNPVDRVIFVQKLKKLFSADPENEKEIQMCLKWLHKHHDTELWEIFASEALESEFYDCAEIAFANNKNYNGLKLISNLQNEIDCNVRKGEVCCFLGKIKEAEDLYRQSGRKDLIRNLRKFFPTKQGAGWYSKDSSDNLLLMQLKAEDLFNSGQLSHAASYFKKLEDTESLLKTLMLTDDVEGLKSLAESLPVVPYNFKALETLTSIFETIGLISEAIQLNLKRGDPVAAVSVALRNGQFQSAIELSKSYDVPIVSETLLQQASKMIHTDDLMEAVKFLKLCGKTFAAGKLLGMAALHALRTNETPNLNFVKKLFTMAGIMLSTRGSEILQNPWSKKSFTPTKSEILEEIDIRFDESVPKYLRPTAIELQWMRVNPWRGLHAIQHLILLHRIIYKCYFYKATKIAHHLKAYTDILGNERVHTLLALVSANGENYFLCSNAFYELSKINHEFFEDVAADLFMNSEMGDLESRDAKCPRCDTKLKDHHAFCQNCEQDSSICMITGDILPDKISVWTCATCEATISLRKHKQHQFCPVCHSTKQ